MVKAGLRSLPFGGKVGCSMLLRVAVLCAGVLGAGAAFAEELGPEQARAFVAGKLFAYTCFDGTVGMGRILDDGSVIGTIRPGGRGEMRFATLPPNTLKVEGGSIWNRRRGQSSIAGRKVAIGAGCSGAEESGTVAGACTAVTGAGAAGAGAAAGACAGATGAAADVGAMARIGAVATDAGAMASACPATETGPTA